MPGRADPGRTQTAIRAYLLTRCLLGCLQHRPHRALGQLVPAQTGTRPPEINLAEHRIHRKQILGGLTHEYQIAA
jgi:hypothetical protein